MKFFIDTANLSEIREAASLGILDGVTTNPSLVSAEGVKDFHAHIAEICKLVSGPVSAEVVSTDFKGMMAEAEKLLTIAPNVTIKVPLTKDGLKACKTITDNGNMVNVTLCFSPAQALLAAKAGATFISPFVGRLDDISHNGMQLIEQIVTIYRNYDFQTEVLVASVRHPLHIVDAALIGADVATMPFKVFDQLVKHPLTDSGIEKFLKDWNKNQ